MPPSNGGIFLLTISRELHKVPAMTFETLRDIVARSGCTMQEGTGTVQGVRYRALQVSAPSGKVFAVNGAHNIYAQVETSLDGTSIPDYAEPAAERLLLALGKGLADCGWFPDCEFCEAP